ncbi:1-aminocyclopropane-1-carboxylate oxidase homolog 8-like [Eucalyptus grandis]|uniref:1-aminocyclopropane-1-carboxylate oxidase homolog 8-like n=1 Tax=Eucalyptus grandis TaxID=71139 RepID=UPI00192EA235|nr:1-aminocyclopropane-1-carboxylate oxidase homolog 8-like [Eucalyptus grandis]
MIGVTNANEQQALNRAQGVRQFEDSNLGVKGLLESGLSTLPPMFIHPPDLLFSLKPVVGLKTDSIPIIDLSGSNSNHDPQSSRKLHVLLPAEVKARIYRRESETGVAFFASCMDLLHSNTACWSWDSCRRPSIIEEVGCVSRELGFFQVVNHGVPTEVMDHTITAVKAFNEQPVEAKARIYRRESGRETDTGVAYFSNVDLFHSKAASWR